MSFRRKGDHLSRLLDQRRRNSSGKSASRSKISKTNHGYANPSIRRDGVLLQENHQRIASIAQPLPCLLKKGANVQNQWGEEQEKAWLTLKKRLSSAPVLSHNDGEAPLEITVDASLFGLGAVLQVWINEVWKPVTYISRKLDPAEENYHANELEALGLVWSLEKLRPYICGRPNG